MTMRDLGLVGAGYWGKNLARVFDGLGSLHTICDASVETLNSYEGLYPEVIREKSFQHLLEDEGIRKIAIAAPAQSHFRLALEAIQAGKDVFVEKPLCLVVEEAEQLIAEAEKYGRILMVGHLLQYHPCVQTVLEMVRDGQLGKLLYVTSNRLNLGKIRSEENSLWSFAPHDISVILALAGSLPDSVSCTGESYLTDGVADTTLTQLKFRSGLRSHIYVSWLNPFKEQKLTVVGSQGMIVFDDTKPWEEKLVLYRDYLTWSEGKIPQANKRVGEKVVVPEAEPLLSECQHFLSCCVDRSQPRTDGKEGLRVLRVLRAAQHSLEAGGEINSELERPVADAPFIHPTAVVDKGATLGPNVKVWHFAHLSSKVSIGAGTSLGQNTFVADGVTIGRNVKIQNNVSVYTGTIVEDDVFLGPSCVLTNVSNPRSQVVRRGLYEQTILKRGASVGANSTIVCGTTIGRYAFVAAGAVVTRSIPDYASVRGVPAKQVGWMSRHGLPLEFDRQGNAVCPESGLRYQLSEDGEGQSRVRCIDLDEDSPLPRELSVGTKNYRDVMNGQG